MEHIEKESLSMKKLGFTLAEVLITLAIVGVVLAVTILTFTTKMQMSKIGPRLAKSVAGFEQASKTVLSDNNVDRLTMLYASGTSFNSVAFLTAMEDHFKGDLDADNNDEIFHAKDGVDFKIAKQCTMTTVSSLPLPHRRMVCSEVAIDIDGIQAGPNKDSRDRFYFQLMDDGSLRPMGGSWDTANKWQTKCPKNQKPTDPSRCAGHVMENGLKAEYK